MVTKALFSLNDKQKIMENDYGKSWSVGKEDAATSYGPKELLRKELIFGNLMGKTQKILKI